MTNMTEDKPSLLPPYDPGQQYGFFGYRENMCTRAIRADNAAMLKECVELDFIDASSEMLDGRMILQYCLQPVEVVIAGDDGMPTKVMRTRAPKCADMLRSLGWSIPEHKAITYGIR